MPIRIYAFAKELGLDNKQLLEICEKANVTGKGSALASLDDDEVVIVKDFLRNEKAGKPASVSPPSGTPTPPMRPPVSRTPRKIGEIAAPKGPAAIVEESEIEAASDQTVAAPVTEASFVSESPANKTPANQTPVSQAPVSQTPVSQTPVNQAPVTQTPVVPITADLAPTRPTSYQPAAKPKVANLLDRLRNKEKDPGSSPSEPSKPSLPRIAPKVPSKNPIFGGKKPAETATSPKQQLPDVPYVPPRRTLPRPDSSVRDLDQRSAMASESAAKASGSKTRKSGVNFKLAALPDVKQPTAGKTSTEKVQKPDIALPQEAIAKVRTGAAPLDAFTKSAKSRVKKKGKSDKTDVVEETAEAIALRRGVRKDRTTTEVVDSEMGLRPTRGPLARRTTNFRRTESRRSSVRKSGASTAAPRKESVVLQLPCSVREFSEATGVPAVKAIFEFQKIGADGVKNINSMVDQEAVEMLIMQMGLDVQLRGAEDIEDQILSQFSEEDDAELMQPRAPIVTFLGHVDHGKTSLLDALIGLNVVAGEAGGITQHIRAYEIFKGEKKIAFVDTPGHEAFTEMRARGANVTDIAVLVVAADDGIMPQTEEAISHARAAEVPIIVALNKIDLPGVTADKAMQDLASHGLLPSEWGGDIEVVKTSALTGLGLNELLETILFTAEIHNYQANPDRNAFGTCLEAEQQSDRGVMAKLMVQGGTLKIGDIVVCGSSFGRVKAIYDTLNRNKKKKTAEPSTPVNVTGFDVPPGAGDKFLVVDDIAKARELTDERRHRGTVERVGGRSTKTSLDRFQTLLEGGDLTGGSGDVVTLNLIIRADVRGSIEAIQKELGKISHPEVQLKIIQALPGGVSVADVRLADASGAVIVGFNVVADEAARALAEELKVEIRRYEVIYKITDDLKATLEGKLKPEEQIVELGMAMVLRVFSVSRTGNIAGCRVMRGSIERDSRVRVIRDSRVIGDYQLDSLKREKDDAKEVQRGMECGIKLAGFNDIKEGDTLEAYKIQEVARTL